MSEGDLFDDLPEATQPPAAPPAEDAEAESVPVEDADFEFAPDAFDPEPDAEPEDAPEIAAGPAVPPLPEPPPATPHRPTTPTVIDAEGLGKTLVELRRKSGLSLEEVAKKTRIKLGYLEALEEENYSALPQLVYVIAYVKNLCGLYAADPATTDALLAGLREQLAYEIPEDIDKSVVSRERDEETRRKLRNITAVIFGGGALLLVLLIFGGALLLVRARRGGAPEEPTVTVSNIDENRILSLLDKPRLVISRIPD